MDVCLFAVSADEIFCLRSCAVAGGVPTDCAGTEVEPFPLAFGCQESRALQNNLDSADVTIEQVKGFRHLYRYHSDML